MSVWAGWYGQLGPEDRDWFRGLLFPPALKVVCSLLVGT